MQSKSTLNLVLGLPSAISHLEKIPPQQGTKAPAKQQQDLVGSSPIVVEKPMEPTKEQKFVAGVTGAALVSLKFVQTSGQEGVSVAYKPATMRVKRFIFVTAAFMAAHSQACRHLVDIFNLATCKWKLLSRDELDSKINGDLKVNMNRQIIVLQAAGEKDGSFSDHSFQKQLSVSVSLPASQKFAGRLKHAITLEDALKDSIFCDIDQSRSRSGISSSY